MRYVVFMDPKERDGSDEARRAARDRRHEIGSLLHRHEHHGAILEEWRKAVEAMAAMGGSEADPDAVVAAAKDRDSAIGRHFAYRTDRMAGLEAADDKTAYLEWVLGDEPVDPVADLVAMATAENYTVQAMVDDDAVDVEAVWHELQNGIVHASWSRTPPGWMRLMGPSTTTTLHGEMGRRSMDVGDMILHDDGRIEMVAGVGFVGIGAMPADRMAELPVADATRLADWTDGPSRVPMA